MNSASGVLGQQMVQSDVTSCVMVATGDAE